MIKKSAQHDIIFISLLLPAIFQAVSGFVLWFVLPRGGGGYQGGRGAAVGGEDTFLWDRHTWIDIHNWVAVALLVLLVIHLILNWKWIFYITKTYFRQK